MGEKNMDLSCGVLCIANDDGSIDVESVEYFETGFFKTIQTAGECTVPIKLSRKSKRYLRKLARAGKKHRIKPIDTFLRRRWRRALFRKWLNMLGICNCQKDGKNAYFFIDEMHEYRGRDGDREKSI